MNRINDDAAFLNRVNTLSIPANLQYMLAVDLCPDTFVTLLELAEQLSHTYFAAQSPTEAKAAHARLNDPKRVKTAEEKATELKLYAFLAVLRLLRINIAHLVGWGAGKPSLSCSLDSFSQRFDYSLCVHRCG